MTMQMPRPTEADKERFHRLVPEADGVEVKPMFGNLGAFVHGNMFMGLFGSDVGLKLPVDAMDDVRRAGGGPFGPSDRPMAGYVTLPADASGELVDAWVASALASAASLPPRTPKARGRSRR